MGLGLTSFHVLSSFISAASQSRRHRERQTDSAGLESRPADAARIRFLRCISRYASSHVCQPLDSCCLLSLITAICMTCAVRFSFSASSFFARSCLG